jgi:hypothetical protein
MLASLGTLPGSAVAAAQASPGPVMSVSGKSLLFDGQPNILLGVSYFGALDAPSPHDADFDTLKSWGVGGVRTWAHWREPIYQKDGALTEQGRARLVRLVQHLQARRFVLELVLLRPGQLPGQPYAVFESEGARLRAVKEITAALRDYRNVLFDLYNEHDHPDGPISHASARALRDAVKAIDPARIVTMSSTGGHLVRPDSRVGDIEAGNLREETGSEPGAAAVDMVAPHFPRTDDWAAATGRRIEAVRAALDAIGRSLPIYLSEEQRADADRPVHPDTFLRAYSEAIRAGAAGWLFHTDAAFDLANKSLISTLRPSERSALSQLDRKQR